MQKIVIIFICATFVISCSQKTEYLKVGDVVIEILEIKKKRDGTIFLKMASKSTLNEDLAFFEKLKRAFHYKAEFLCKPRIYDNTTQLGFLIGTEIDNYSNFVAWQYIYGNVKCIG